MGVRPGILIRSSPGKVRTCCWKLRKSLEAVPFYVVYASVRHVFDKLKNLWLLKE